MVTRRPLLCASVISAFQSEESLFKASALPRIIMLYLARVIPTFIRRTSLMKPIDPRSAVRTQLNTTKSFSRP